MILKVLTLGSHAVIGAGSVVTKDVSAYSFAAGNLVLIVSTISNPKLQ